VHNCFESLHSLERGLLEGDALLPTLTQIFLPVRQKSFFALEANTDTGTDEPNHRLKAGTRWMMCLSTVFPENARIHPGCG
jgi:hypothetical protein